MRVETCGVSCQACARVEPLAVIRTAVTVDFDVPLDPPLRVKAPPPRTVRR